MTAQVLCLLTIHGIGFEQAPQGAQPGYADVRHEQLSAALGADLLGDDPHRKRSRPGQNGAIYVESLWAPSDDEEGQGPPTGPPTRADGQPIAHVALVYSRLEPVGPHGGSAAVALEMAAVSAGHYASILGLVHMAFADIRALLHHQHPAASAAPGLQPRRDLPPDHHWLRLPLRPHAAPAPAAPPPAGLLGTIRNLEDDVAAYVSRNDLRERVRSFVREALLRLLSRPDVAGVVINAHSNGTVVAFDVLRDLPLQLAAKVRGIVTAGSPLRKYAELFNWGTEAGPIGAMGAWTNFWDELDPVADPLSPPASWRRGDRLPAGGPASLYQSTDPATGEQSWFAIADRKVDNIKNGGGGGLPAHDYWDNTREVVQPVAAELRGLV